MGETVEAPRIVRGDADVIVVGAGLFGLWAARHAIRAGKRVLVLEKRRVGAGASGGFVGALMPHMPDRWNAKKQFQFEALVSLEAAIRELEADTGHDCGYARCGRLMPLTHERMLGVIAERIAGARANWPGFSMERLDSGQLDAAWLDPAIAPFGAQRDDLSARVAPRRLLAALAAFVRAHGEIRESMEVASLADRTVIVGDGSRIEAGEVIVANGFEAYPLLQPWLGALTGGAPAGRGVKGQAMLLDFPARDRPILYADSAYCVGHADGTVAIGASSHDAWDGEPDAFDPADTGFAEKAFRLAPALREAPVIGRWAGVRPRNMLKPHDTEPYFGPVPGLQGVAARIGGFKTSVATAHVEAAMHTGYIS